MRTRDHVVPKSKGGTKTVWACLKCNALKADLSLEEFRQLRGGIEFWGEMRKRLADQETAWILSDPAGHGSPEKKKVVAQVNERPSYEPTVDLSKIKRYTIGPKIKRGKEESTRGIAVPCAPPDLLGVKFGRFTVERRLTGKWEVRCACGAMEVRKSKAIRNPANTFDACVECRRPVRKLHTDIFKETGVEVSWEDCFWYIYRRNSETEEELSPIDNESNQSCGTIESGDPMALREIKLLEKIEHLLESVERRLAEIERRLPQPHTPTTLVFQESSMPLPPVAGNTLVYTATLSPAGSAFPAGTSFTVVSSDPTVTPTVDPTGLIITIPLPETFVDNPDAPFNVVYTASGITPEPSTSPTSLTATITPSVPVPPTPTPTGIAFVQTT
jgi:hypothetical protein